MNDHPFYNLKKGQVIILTDGPGQFTAKFHSIRGQTAVLIEDVSYEGRLRFKVNDPTSEYFDRDFRIQEKYFDCVTLPDNRVLLKQD